MLDRGNASVPLLERLWKLREDAAAAGGEFVLLLGNHELLNMQGRTRFVHEGELETFGGGAKWKRAFDPKEGALGRRLASQDAFAIRGEGGCRTLFIHGGLRSSLAAQYGSIDMLNLELRAQLLVSPQPLKYIAQACAERGIHARASRQAVSSWMCAMVRSGFEGTRGLLAPR